MRLPPQRGSLGDARRGQEAPKCDDNARGGPPETEETVPLPAKETRYAFRPLGGRLEELGTTARGRVMSRARLELTRL